MYFFFFLTVINFYQWKFKGPVLVAGVCSGNIVAQDLIFREGQCEASGEKGTCSWWLTESHTGTVGRESD